jgi:integrase
VDTGTLVGKRQRWKFETRGEAESKQAQIANLFSEQGRAGFFSDEERADIHAARSILRGKGLNVSLADVCREYAERHRPEKGDLTAQQIFDRLMAAKNKHPKELSESYLRSIEDVLEPWLADGKQIPNRERLLSSFKSNEIEAYIDERQAAAITKANIYRYLAMMFSFAVKAKHLASSPMEFENRWATARKPRPGILTYEEARLLLVAAWKDYETRKDPSILAFVLFGLFCGIRKEELLRLTHSSVKSEGEVEITETEAKTRQLRTVRMPLNCRIVWDEVEAGRKKRVDWREKNRAFYNPVPTEEDLRPLVSHKNFRKRFAAVLASAGIDKWPKNALRHTFASFFYSATNDRDELMRRLGHASDAVTFESYTKRVPEKLPIGYFSLCATEAQNQRLHQEEQVLMPYVGDQDELRRQRLRLYRLT